MSIQALFEEKGGIFLSSEKEIAEKLKSIQCFIFDWDGVFNQGIKVNEKGSPFSEIDSMGLNMLRFSYWLIHGKLPISVIITGANNMNAFEFAEREHLNAVYLNSKNKKEIVSRLSSQYSLASNEIAFVFDDIIDLSALELCDLSFCIKRQSSPLFEYLITNKKLCDYISGNEGGKHAVREISELLIGLHANYDEVVQKRTQFVGEYETYLSTRNAIKVEFHNVSNPNSKK